ncbi:MAG: RNA-guided pseudouridylation complex pseudouridine synthase subunit Cbf5 [Archaeoglobaceae archaeon]|nr:RNA-guided pseudouridylation complex pseudouridine synthase subunit Cbf5 [Archaeoglobaceae archaeon]MDW8128234.1 RNA-guided pseudouridylation complex pseudouridine synthase subunit Cbf5 [Archaeoglobaceae archaeon]
MKTDRFIIIEEVETDERYGTYPSKRSIEEHIRKGFVCIDKPMGPTSHEVVVWVRKILEVQKTGHAGTLDPRVTGVLPVFIETATKLVKFLQESGKEYVCLMRLHGDVKEEKIREVFRMFTGKIFQKPPLKSAVKKQLRIREIYSMEILEISGREVLFKVSTESGTYIRKLCKDMGEVLGVGAHMQELRRTRTGNFSEEDCYNLQDLLDAFIFWKEEGEEKYLREVIKPMEAAVVEIPKIVIKDTAVDAICHGANLSIKGVVSIERTVNEGGKVAILTAKGELVALGKALMSAENMIELKKGFVVDIERVIMDRGVYPSVWKSS